MSNPKELYTKLKEADPDSLIYVKELEAINAKLHKQNIKYQAQNISDKKRISELEKQLQKTSERPMINIITHGTDSSKEK